MCLYLRGQDLSKSLPVLQQQIIPAYTQVEPSRRGRLFCSSSKSKLPLTASPCRVQMSNTFLVFPQREMVNSLYVCSALQVSIDLPASPSKFGSRAMLVAKMGGGWSLMPGCNRFLLYLGIQRIPNGHTSHTCSLVICGGCSCFFSYPILCSLLLFHKRGITLCVLLSIGGPQNSGYVLLPFHLRLLMDSKRYHFVDYLPSSC